MTRTSTYLTVGGLAVASAFGALMLMSPPARAPYPRSPDGEALIDPPDAAFLEQALRAGAAAATAARLAAQRSREPELRRLAAEIEREHSATNRALAALGGIRVPPLDPEQRAVQDRLIGLSGREFDMLWLQQMQRTHARGLALHGHAATEAATGEARQLAVATLAMLHEHMDRLQELMPGYTGQRAGGDAPDANADAVLEAGTAGGGTAGNDDDPGTTGGHESGTAPEALDQDDASTAAGQRAGAGIVADEDAVSGLGADDDEIPARARARGTIPDGGAG